MFLLRVDAAKSYLSLSQQASYLNLRKGARHCKRHLRDFTTEHGETASC